MNKRSGARAAREPGWLFALLGWVLLGCGVAHAATFTGTVFEDANYGGGAGRTRVGVRRRGARGRYGRALSRDWQR